MDDLINIAARIVAAKLSRAPLIRTASMVRLPRRAPWGIAPIRVAAEQRPQAIAFGHLNRPPSIVISRHPLSHDASFLEPFADELDHYLAGTMAGEDVQIWLPHGAAVDVVAILGQRYARNPSANDALKRMGAQCSMLSAQTRYDGQQTVVVATDLLRRSVGTGQMAVENLHLGALLAWVACPAGVDPESEAERRSLEPAAALLRREDDERVERLRKRAKKRGPRGERAGEEIDLLLHRGALQEWALLVEAYAAYVGLGLAEAPTVDTLAQESRGRLLHFLTPPEDPEKKKGESLSYLLDDLEYNRSLAEEAAVRGDALTRWTAREKGIAFESQVVDVVQPTPNTAPCTVILRVTQGGLRLRGSSTTIRTIDGLVTGRVVRHADDEDETGARLLTVEVIIGVQKGRRPSVGATREWVVVRTKDLRHRRKKVYGAMRRTASPLVGDGLLPPATPIAPRDTLPPDTLLAIAREMRTA